MAVLKSVIVAFGLLVLAGAPRAVAKEKTGHQQSGNVPGNAETALGPDAEILQDAVRLCQFVVADDPQIITALENENWSHEIKRDIGNTPYYKEIRGTRTYDGVGAAKIWGFIEDYPGYNVGYCVLTIDSPQIRFSIEPLNEIEHMIGDTTTNGLEVFGAWRDDSASPSVFVHAYHNADTFSYQINRINKLD